MLKKNPGHSTIYQLLKLYHDIVSSIDNRKHTCVIFLWLVKSIWQGLT